MSAWSRVAAAWIGVHLTAAWPAASAPPSSSPPPPPSAPPHPEVRPSADKAAPALPPSVIAPIAPVAAVPDGCGNDRVDEVARALSVWAARFKDAQKAAYADRNCDRP